VNACPQDVAKCGDRIVYFTDKTKATDLKVDREATDNFGHSCSWAIIAECGLPSLQVNTNIDLSDGISDNTHELEFMEYSMTKSIFDGLDQKEKDALLEVSKYEYPLGYEIFFPDPGFQFEEKDNSFEAS